MPMQPSPIADVSGPWDPSFGVTIATKHLSPTDRGPVHVEFRYHWQTRDDGEEPQPRPARDHRRNHPAGARRALLDRLRGRAAGLLPGPRGRFIAPSRQARHRRLRARNRLLHLRLVPDWPERPE